MIATLRFDGWDNAGERHHTVQTWAEIPGTGVWVITAVEHLAVDPTTVPPRPERPA